MSVLKSIVIAISMFSKIPVPTLEWKNEDMKYVTAAFPLIGIVIAIICYLWYKLMLLLDFSNIIMSVGLLLIPIIISGGLHLDGLCDTSDALASRAPLEKKQAILKDPHIGAFGVINLVVYLIVYFALILEMPKSDGMIICFALSFVLSRSLAGLSLILFRPSHDSGIGRLFSETAAKRSCGTILTVLTIISAFLIIFYGGISGLAAIIIIIICFVIYKATIIPQFDGMSGDLAGWFVQVCEIVVPIAIVVAYHLVEVIL